MYRKQLRETATVTFTSLGISVCIGAVLASSASAQSESPAPPAAQPPAAQPPQPAPTDAASGDAAPSTTAPPAAQPPAAQPPPPAPTDAATGDAAPSTAAPPPQAPTPPPASPTASASPEGNVTEDSLYRKVEASKEPVPTAPPPPQPRRAFPEVLTIPTGYLLPAGVLYSRNAVDTAGGFSSDLRVGLGDVAEFGVATLDAVRFRNNEEAEPERIRPFTSATFRMGVAENRLFKHQPGFALGFRKSFVHETGGHKVRTAELALVASKSLGARGAIHLGGAFWDASLASPDLPEVSLHDRPLTQQLRGFAGIELSPFDDSQVLIDFNWVPEFCPGCADPISLRAVLSWGVRYNVWSWLTLESGVRIPNIQGANLLDAQIFGQLTVVTWRLRDAIDRLK